MNASKENVKARQILSDLPSALLSWYDFKKEGAVLYLGSKEDWICRILEDQGHSIICRSLEESLDEKFLASRQGEFAYVIAVQCLEKADNPAEVLKSWKSLLKDDGCLLLGMNNRLGACYFSGERDPYSGRNFDSIENYRQVANMDWNKMEGRLYAKDQLEAFLRESGFKQFMFFSVLPKLTAPQLIFRQDFLPKEELGVRLFPLYENPDTVFLEEEHLYSSLVQNGLFHTMANAWLIQCPLDGDFCEARQVTLSVDRGPEQAQATVLRKTEVEKIALYPEGQKQLERLWDNTRRIQARGLSAVPVTLREKSSVMPYIEGFNGQRFLHQLAFRDKEEFVQRMDEFRDLILSSSELIRHSVHVSKLLDGKKELGEDGSDQDDLGIELCLRHGYIDLVPINTIYADGKFWILDQEFMEELLPVKVVLTRMIDLVYGADQRLESLIPMNFFLERYDLSEHLGVWRRKAFLFTEKLRSERELKLYHERVRRNQAVVHSNRQKVNYSSRDYLRFFVNIFDGLEGKKLFLFGSGRFARRFLTYYGKKYPIEGIIDNDREKWGRDLDGISIYPPHILNNLPLNSFKVLICIKNYLSVMKQLDSIGPISYGVYDGSMEYPNVPLQRIEKIQDEKEKCRKPYHVGYIAGVFDLFHIGHLNLLKRAKEQCDHLIVGVVTDEGVRRNKKTNPFIPFEERLEIVRSCRYVDEAVEIPLDFPSTKDAYRMYHFDVQFSGSDYEHDPDWLAEQQFLEREGAEMVFFPYTKSTSSTKLKQLISEQIICQNKGCNPETDSM